MRQMNALINIGRSMYGHKAFRYPINAMAGVCSRIAAYERARGKPLLPQYRHGRLRLILSNDPLWNNALMQRVYEEGPKNKNTIGIMQLLVTREPVKDRLFAEMAKIAPDSLEAQEIINELDGIVSSKETYTVDGITKFAELFEGKFTQPPRLTGGFRQFVSPLIMVFMSKFIREEKPEFYEQHMRMTAMTFKATEILSGLAP